MNDFSPSVPSPKKLDVASIVISVIASLFIIAGTYLLIQALKPVSKPTSSLTSNSSSRSSVKSSSSALSSVAMADATNSASMSSSSAPLFESSAAMSSQSSSIPASSVSSSSTSMSSSSSSSSALASALKSGKTDAQIIVRVEGSDSVVTKLSVTDSGFTGTRWLQKGAFLNLANSLIPTKTTGTTYKINLIISDSQTTFEIKDVGTVEQLK